MSKMMTIKVTKEVFDAIEDRRDPDMPTHGDVIDGLLRTCELALKRFAEKNDEAKGLRAQRDDLAMLLKRLYLATGLCDDPKIVKVRAQSFAYLERKKLLGKIMRCRSGRKS
jgi:hypothetical protein